MTMHVLETDGVILEFGNKRVLYDVYLKCETGKVTGLLGRNGVGKTCLLNIIYGELPVHNASVRLNGLAICNTFRSPADLRYLPQFNFIPTGLRVKQVFNHFRLDFDAFISIFPEFKKYYSLKLSSLSSGERRIVEIYSILGSKTKFCMLDEPFSQVMPIHVEAIKQIVEMEKTNKGIILTDHMYQHVADVSDSLYVISRGKTFLTRSPDDLKMLGYLNSNM